MIITTQTGELSGTLLLILAPVLWFLQVYLALAIVRLILGQLAADWAGRAARGLAPLTDWAPDKVRRLAGHWFKRPVPPWAGWVSVIGAALILRNVLLGTLLAVSSPMAP